MPPEEQTFSASDPRMTIAAEPPNLGDAEAVAIVRKRYGLDVSVRSLVSERDQNFAVTTKDGAQYVFKVANHAEDPVVTDFQIQALLHIEKTIARENLPIVAPSIVRTLDGDAHFSLEANGAAHVARLVTYVAGETIGERIPSARLSRNMGIYLARLGRALADFTHPGSQQHLLWDIQRTLDLRDIVEHIPKENVLGDVTHALDTFEQHVSPVLPDLRRQVIHSDFNPDNALVAPESTDTVVGVIDFGDMLEAPLIADLAIAASYLRPSAGDPLTLISEMIAGYTSVTSLQASEIDILFELIKARLCASIAILYWRASFRAADDPYLGKLLAAESFAEVFLARLIPVPREHAATCFSQVCASVRQR